MLAIPKPQPILAVLQSIVGFPGVKRLVFRAVIFLFAASKIWNLNQRTKMKLPSKEP